MSSPTIRSRAFVVLMFCLAGCSAAPEPSTLDSDSPQAVIDRLEAQDKDAVDILFSTSFTSVWSAVSDNVGKAIEEAGNSAPSIAPAAATPPAELNGSINETITLATGGSLIIKGTYTSTRNEDLSTSVKLDLEAAWDNLTVQLKTGHVVTSGSGSLSGTYTLNSKTHTGAMAWTGNLIVDGVGIPFELKIALITDTISMTGIIADKSYKIVVDTIPDSSEEVQLSDDTSIASITLNGGTLIPALSDGVNIYEVTLPAGTSSLTVAVVAADDAASVQITKGSGDCSVNNANVTALVNGHTCVLSLVVTAADGTTKRSVALTIRVREPGMIEYAGAASEVVLGSAFTVGIPARANLVAPTFSIDKALPVGLSLDEATGEIYGNVPVSMANLVTPTTYTIQASDTMGNSDSTQIELSVVYKQYFDSATWPTEIKVGSNSSYLSVSREYLVVLGFACVDGTYFYGCPGSDSNGLKMRSSEAFPIELFFTDFAAGTYQAFYKVSTVMAVLQPATSTDVKTQVVGAGSIQETVNANASPEMSDFSFAFTITGATNKLMFSNTGSGDYNHGIDNIVIKRTQ